MKHRYILLVYTLLFIQQVSFGSDIPDILTSTNKSDKCVTMMCNLLPSDTSHPDAIKPLIEEDLDNDGYIESVLVLSNREGHLAMVASKKNNEGEIVFDRFDDKIDKDRFPWDGARIAVMLHDFDNDGKKEIVFAIGGYDENDQTFGAVYKINGTGIDPKKAIGLKNWFQMVGSFSSTWSYPQIDGQNILARDTMIGGKNEISKVYVNGKLIDFK